MIHLMGCRYESLKAILLGYTKTGIQLVAFNGKNFFCADCSDDLGLYYFVPKLARLFDITLDQAIYLFFYGIIVLSSFLALIGFFLLSKSWLFRTIATLSVICFFILGHRAAGDVYLVNAAIILAVVPLSIYFFREKKRFALFLVFLFFSGIAIGYANQIRSFSGIPVFLFLVLGLFFYLAAPWRKKFLFLGLLCGGLLIPKLHFNYLIAQRNKVLGTQKLECKEGHVFWHTVHGGFGFLSNDYGFAYDDAKIVESVCETYPEVVYPSQAYEKAAKKEVFRLVREHLGFVLNTLFAKFGILLSFLIFFANIGLILTFLYRKPWILELMFWVGIMVSSIPGFIALPNRLYLFGTFAFAMVYGLVSIDYAISGGFFKDLKKKLER